MANFDRVVEQNNLAEIFTQIRDQFQRQDAQQQKQSQDQQHQSNLIKQLMSEMQLLRNQVNIQGQQMPPPIVPPPPPPYQPPPPYPPPPIAPPNLNLSPPPSFLGNPSELKSFKLRLCQFIGSAPATYPTDEYKIMLAGSYLKGSAGQWYECLVDPITNRVPTTITFDVFLGQLSDYFGGGVTSQTLERSLINLRQTGSVSDFAIAFQNITNAFNPRWPDAPLIFEFMQKLKEVIRYELTARGALPIM